MSINVRRVCQVFYTVRVSVCACSSSVLDGRGVATRSCSYFSVAGYKGADGA